ncbi:hypothetical protein [Lactiplantibacillus plantarum]|uniref:hypothetical protein n=1 Tax=Lactiplantibacillus plantarum TaxID=1590 RepID=UPI0024B999E8|nr:hypothetical protein [Lactiplantibacillus plantarum]
MDWGGYDKATTHVGAASIEADWIISPQVIREEFVDPTILRLIHNLSVSWDATDGRGAVGIIAWDGVDATVPPATDLPAPWSQPNLDWMWHTHLNSSAMAVLGWGYTDVLANTSAKRRMGNSKGLLVVAQSGAVGFDWTFGCRYLLKE